MTKALTAILLLGLLAQPRLPQPTDPACPTHDPTALHTLYDSDRGCHYDHSHGATLAELTAWLTRWGIPTDRAVADPLALAMQTPNENVNKHTGYRWTLYDVEAPGCWKDDKGEVDRFGATDACLVAFAARIHD